MNGKELISKVIDKGIGLGTKIKEYMIDDTMNDLNNLMGSKKKDEIPTKVKENDVE